MNQHNNSRNLIHVIIQLVISDLGWLILFLCNLQNSNLQIFLKKTPHVNPSTEYQQKKEKERKKKSKHFCKHLLGVLVEFP